MLTSHTDGARVLGTRDMEGQLNLLQKLLVSTFVLTAYKVLERYRSSDEVIHVV